MYKTDDKMIDIVVVKDYGSVVYPAADYTMINLPSDPEEARSMFVALFNSPIDRHVLMVFVRYNREDKLKALANLSLASHWTYLDTVHVWSEKPSSSSNIGFLPVIEEAFIFYKGQVPNIAATSWFGGDMMPNATNLWGVTPFESESRPFTYHKKFSWEIGILLANLASPLETKKMIYALDSDQEHVLKFSKQFGMKVQFYCDDAKEASKIFKRYQVLK